MCAAAMITDGLYFEVACESFENSDLTLRRLYRALYSMLATSIKIIANFHLKRALNGAKEAIFLGRICLLTNPPQTNLYGRRERLDLVNPFLITSHLLSTTVPVFTTFRYLWI